LYELLWNFAGAALLLYLASKLNLQWGKVFGLYLVVYSTGRIWIESIRIDPSEIILGLRVNIWSALIGITIGLAIIWVQNRRHPGAEPSVFAPGREPAEEGTASDPSEEALGKKEN
jgi:prolipoprotein diacylglyceryltransferase